MLVVSLKQNNQCVKIDNNSLESLLMNLDFLNLVLKDSDHYIDNSETLQNKNIIEEAKRIILFKNDDKSSLSESELLKLKIQIMNSIRHNISSK